MPDFTDKLRPRYDGPATLAAERARSTVDVGALSNHLLSRDDFLNRQSRIVAILQQEKLFQKNQQLNLSRPERYHLGLARAKAIRRLAAKHGWNLEDCKMAEYLVDEMSPFHLQMSMFITTVSEQGSEEQRKHWLPKINAFEIIGAYAQTELGHGSNVRGLETTATWLGEGKGFEIHSPYLTASKWWNGSLGRTATHAIVVAQLMLPHPKEPGKYVSRGPQPFIVQIRDEKTHRPLDGIVVGDIGPKYGYASMDNGYMLFDHFHVPHSAMLSRYAQVSDETGVYSKKGHPALVYGSLTHVRANIIMHARLILARAVTIAVRYTSIRRQFRSRDDPDEGKDEMIVLDYPTVQIRILPLLATTFALHYTGEMMYNLYARTRQSIEKGDFSEIAELHAASSGLKSLCTTLAADGIETCRRAMGGHGFGGGSGLIGINADYLSKPTVEGDNWMITQQVAQHLIKKMDECLKGGALDQKDGTTRMFKDYIGKRRKIDAHEMINATGNFDDQAIVSAFALRATEMSHRAYEARIVHCRPWNSLLIQLHRLSRAYSEFILISTFHEALQSSTLLPTTTRDVLRSCFRLYAFYTIDLDPLSFLNTSSITQTSLSRMPDAILDLMQNKLRPHAVRLVDAWSIPDYLLDSALGRNDGKVYETLYDMAHRQNPLNETTFNPDWRSDEIVHGSRDGGRHLLAKL